MRGVVYTSGQKWADISEDSDHLADRLTSEKAMSAKGKLNGSKSWTGVTTREAFPILLRSALNGKRITYGELNDAVVASGGKGALPIAYRYVAGRVGDVCRAVREEMGEAVPPLNAIIVNSVTGLPSHGVDSYVAGFLGLPKSKFSKLSSSQRNAYARQATERALVFDGWNRVAKHLGIGIPSTRKKSVGADEHGGKIPPPDPKKFARGPESAAHKALKAWVAEHPEKFTAYGVFKKGECEKRLSSGDEVDAYFESPEAQLAVEVKTAKAPIDEIERGVFQCVKYRAVLRAMQLTAEQPPNAQAILVMDQFPSARTVKLAARLSVTILVADELRAR